MTLRGLVVHVSIQPYRVLERSFGCGYQEAYLNQQQVASKVT
jgi:hypothetical protein